jgi:hypothetical protein
MENATMFRTSRVRFRSLASVLAVFTLGAAATACDDDPLIEDPDPAEAVVAIRLTVGAQTITINDLGTVTGGPIVLPRAATTVTAVFLDEDDAIVAGLDAEFRLEVTIANGSLVTFSRTAAFSGTLTGVAAGQTTLEFALFHIEENHEDFGFFPVPTTVN